MTKITENPQVLKVLGVDTLEMRNEDRLDFHEMSVYSMAAAIQIAYQIGFAEGARAALRAEGADNVS